MQPRRPAEGCSPPNLPVLSAPPPASPAGREKRLRRSLRSPKSPATSSPASARRSRDTGAAFRKKTAKDGDSPSKLRISKVGSQERKGTDSQNAANAGGRSGDGSEGLRGYGKDEGASGDAVDKKKETGKTNEADPPVHVVSLLEDGVTEEVLEESAPKRRSGKHHVTEEVQAESRAGGDVTEEVLAESGPRLQKGDENVTEEVLDESKPRRRSRDNNVTEEVLAEGRPKRRSAEKKVTEEGLAASKPKQERLSGDSNVTEEVLAESTSLKPSLEENITEEVLAESKPKRGSENRGSKSHTPPDKGRRRSEKAPALRRRTWTSRRAERQPSASVAREQSRSDPGKELPSIGLHAMNLAEPAPPSDAEQVSPETPRQRKRRGRMEDDESSSESGASSSPRPSPPVTHSRPYPRKRAPSPHSDDSSSDSDSDQDHSEESDSGSSDASSEPRPPRQTTKPRKRPSANGIVRKNRGKRPRAILQKQVRLHKPEDANVAKRGQGSSLIPVMKMSSETVSRFMGKEDATFEEALLHLDDKSQSRRRRGRPSKSVLKERERLSKLRDKMHVEMRALEEQRGERRQRRAMEDIAKRRKSTQKEESGSSGSSYESDRDSETPQSSPSKIPSEHDSDVTPVKNAEKVLTKPSSKESRMTAENEDCDMSMGDDEKGDPAQKKPGSASFARFKNKKTPSPKQTDQEAEPGPTTEMRLASDKGDEVSAEQYSQSDKDEEEEKGSSMIHKGSGMRKKRNNQTDYMVNPSGRPRAVKGPRKSAVQRALVSSAGGKSMPAFAAGGGKTLPRYTPDRKRKERTSCFASLGRGERDTKRRRGRQTSILDSPRDARNERIVALSDCGKSKTLPGNLNSQDKGSGGHEAHGDGADGQMDGDTLAAHKALEEKDHMIVSLRGEMAQMQDKLDKESSRALELEEALGLGINMQGPSASEVAKMSTKLIELEAQVAERDQQLSERDDRLREKAAAMKGFLYQIKRLEAQVSAASVAMGGASGAGSASGALQAAMWRAAELEGVLSERDAELEGLRKETWEGKGVTEEELRGHATEVAKLSASLSEKERHVARLQAQLRERDGAAEEQLKANLSCIAELEVALGEKSRRLERAGTQDVEVGEGEEVEEVVRAGLVKVAELEAMVEERDERIGSLEMQVERHATVLKNSVKANRNLQQKLYAVNRVR